MYPGRLLAVSATIAALFSANASIRSAFAASCPSFTARAAVGTPGEATRPAVGDFNGDGKLDVAEANLSLSLNAVSLLANDGAGNLGSPINSSAGDPANSLGQSALAVGDFNEDGKLDLVVVKLWEATLTVLLGDGNGNFSPAPTNANYATGGFPFDVATADLDGDGHLDVVVANFNSGDVTLYFGDGTGHFTPPPAPFPASIPVGGFPTALAIGDLNQDGFPEIVVAQEKGVTIVYRDVGRHYFTVKIPVPGSPNGIAIAQMNNDLFPDVVVGDLSSGIVHVLLNTGSTFAPNLTVGPAIATGSTFGAAIAGVRAGDLDGDGKTDIAVLVSNGQFLIPTGEPAVRTLLGDGNGGLTPAASVLLGRDPQGITLADMNGDGTLDLVVADGTDGVYVATNNCAGSSPLDIAATGLEVVQVVQDVSNDVPLIEGKRTIARGYATATRTAANVGARLFRLDAAGNALDSVLPINPLGRITVGTAPSRTLPDDSFRFELPEPWTHGTLKLRLEVNASGLVNESNKTNNTATATVTFVSSRKLKVTLVDYRWDLCADADAMPDDYICKTGAAAVDTTPEFPDSEMTQIESNLRRRLPVPTADVDRIVFKDPVWRTIKSASIVPGARELNRVIEVHQMLQTASPGRIYVWLNRRYHPGAAYVYDPNYPERGWDAVSDTADAAVHEVGHLLGLKHTNCSGSERDPGPYPYPGGKIGGPMTNPTQFAGYSMPDANAVDFGSVVPPTVGDEMSYCSPRWPSDVTYRAWLTAIQSRPAFVDPSGDFLLVNGTIKPDGSAATLGAVQRLTQVAALSSAQPGAFRIRLFDVSGTVLADKPFTPGAILTHRDPSDLGFSEVFNWVAGTRRVALVSSTGAELASRLVSANAPMIFGVAQGGGSTLPASGNVTISWIASDPDGDPLAASIQYSTDDGATWNAVATGITGSSFTVDAAALKGTKGGMTGRFRLLVSDGTLSAAAQTAAFVAPGHPPTIRIASPAAGTRLELGQSVQLEAVALDREDGVLDGASITWSSDRDGTLGIGRLSSARLSEGLHTITLAASDSDGATSNATTSVRVARGNAAGSPPVASAGPDIRALEGETVVLDGTGSSDADGDPLRYAWTIVGAPVETVVLQDADTATPSFVPPDAGTYTFRLTVSDGLNAPVSDDIVVTVANVAPVVAITAPITGQLFAAGNVAAAASFTDPGLEDEHTCRINWDVDAPTLVDFGVVNESTRTCTASRALGAGVYTIVVSVDDGDGGVGAAQVQVIVYDPAAGFVTGGGWIQSPPGAAAAAPTASGRANFGFELRYKRGAAVPAGQTEFAFKTGGIDFHSTSYDWLVVVGSKAQFQGSGTVNGVAGYSFLATVVDGKIAGSASAFRIRIWNASGVVYDSVPGAPDDLDRASPASLGGGSVVIHN